MCVCEAAAQPNTEPRPTTPNLSWVDAMCPKAIMPKRCLADRWEWVKRERGEGKAGAKGARACQSFSQLVIMAQNPISKCWVHWLRTQRACTDDDMSSTGREGERGKEGSCHSCYCCCTWVATVYGLARSVFAHWNSNCWWNCGEFRGAWAWQITRISMATSSDKLSEKCQQHMDNATAHKAQTNSAENCDKRGEESGRNIQSIQQTIDCNYEIQRSVKNKTILRQRNAGMIYDYIYGKATVIAFRKNKAGKKRRKRKGKWRIHTEIDFPMR